MSDSQSGEDGGLRGDFESDEDLELDDDDEVFDLFNHTKGGKKKRLRLEANELQELLKDAETDISDLALTTNGTVSPKKRRKAEKESHSFNKEEEATSEPPKKKQKTGKEDKESTKPRIAVFDLIEPEFEHSTSKPTPSPLSNVADSFGEQTVLQSFDAADKKARKKSLRFHTSRIESAAIRRDKGTKNLLGGDDDIPYKERKKQKEVREAKEIERKGRGQGGDDLNDWDPEMDMDVEFAGFGGGVAGRKSGKERSLDESDEDADPSEYYSLVERSAKERKEKKKAEYDAAKAAQRCVFSTSDLPRALLTSIISVMPL